MIFKIKFSNQIYRLSYLIVVATVTILLLVYYLHLNKAGNIAAAIMLLAYVVPTLYLHIEYYLTDVGKEIRINNNAITVHFRKEKIKTYSFSDVLKIVINKSGNYEERGIPVAAFEVYYYVKIFMVSGESIIVTNLMARKLEEDVKEISGMQIFRSRRIFPSLNLESKTPKLIPLKK